MLTAVKITVRGRVQGVGFRPFVFQLADNYHLNGKRLETEIPPCLMRHL